MVRRRSARKPRALGLASTCCTHRPGAAHAPQCPCALAASWLLAVCPDAPNPPRVPLYYTHTKCPHHQPTRREPVACPCASCLRPVPPNSPHPPARSPQPPAGKIGQGNTRAMGLGADADVEFPRLLPSPPVPSLNPLAGWPAAGPTRRHARARTQARTHAGAHTPCAQAGVHTHIPAHAQGGWWGSGMGGGCA